MNHSNTPDNSLGGYLAIGALINSAVNNVAQYDAFWHSAASIMTCIAAGLSIYFTLKKRKG